MGGVYGGRVVSEGPEEVPERRAGGRCQREGPERRAGGRCQREGRGHNQGFDST